MTEKALECKLVNAVKAMGGQAPKFTSPGTNGMPDRLLLFPGGRLAFAEIKRPGEKPTAVQQARHGMLRKLGFIVYVVDSMERISEVIADMGGDSS